MDTLLWELEYNNIMPAKSVNEYSMYIDIYIYHCTLYNVHYTTIHICMYNCTMCNAILYNVQWKYIGYIYI